MITKKLEDPNASTEEKLWATAKGAGIGLVIGTLGGAVGAAGISIGATSYALYLATAVITTPIACVLGVFSNLLIGPDQEADLTPSFWPPEIIYPPDWFPKLQYNPNNPQEMDRETSVSLSVIGGISPYTWHVSENGFTLSQGETYSLYNTLNADSTACGSAKITVKDKYGTPVTGYVRCTTGKWSDWSSSRRRLAYCSNPWVNTCNEDSHTRTLIVGKSKWTFGSFHGYFCTDSPDCFVWTEPGMPTPEPPCGSPYGCWDGGNCPTCAPIGRPYPFFEVCDYYEWVCE